MILVGFAFWYFSQDRKPSQQQKDFASYSPSASPSKPEDDPRAPENKKRHLPSTPLPSFAEPSNSVVFGVKDGHSPQEIEELTQIPLLRAREVQIRENLIHQLVTNQESVLHFALFDDIRINANVKIKKTAPMNGLFVTGTVEGYPVSDLSLTLLKSNLVGRISLGNRGFQIVSSARKTHYIVEVDTARLPQVDKGGAFVPKAPAPKNAKLTSPMKSLAKITQLQAPTSPETAMAAPPERTIRLIFLYTPKARMAAGSVDAIRAEITNEINITNSVFEKSGVSAALELVHIQETNYPESTRLAFDLDRLSQYGDGFLDETQALKRTHNADLVHLLVSTYQPDACGIHWIATTSDLFNQNPGRSYGVSARNCSYKMTVTHELGHGFGADHDVPNATTASVAWARGIVDLSAKFRTMMAYTTTCNNTESGCPVIPYFSNTVTTYNGRPLGNANANNATRIQQLAPIIAANSTYATIEPSSINNAKSGEAIRLSITLPPGYANATRIQWFQAANGGGFVEIPGAFNYYHDFTYSSPIHFYARVTGPGYEIQTATSYISNAIPRTNFLIERHPTNISVNQGQTATLNVLVQAPKEAVSYAWYFNNQPIAGISSSLNFVPSQSGDVHVVVSNSSGSITSLKARVEVLAKPVFTKDLPAQLMIPKGPAISEIIQVTVSGNVGVTYQWYKNGVAIPGKTDSILTFGSADDSVKGEYWVIAKNSVGETKSLTMRVDTYDKPNITVQPSPTEILLTAGKSISLTVQAQGYNLNYRWHRNGQPIGDAENSTAKDPTFIINSASSSHEGVYHARVSNGAGAVNSVEVYIGTPSAPVILTQPTDILTYRGTLVVMTVVPKAFPPPQYRWTRTLNGVSTQLSANTRELVIPKADWEHQAQYSVEVSNALGTVRSNPATLKLYPVLRAATIELTKDKSKVPLSRTGGFLPVENLGDILKEHP